MKIRHGALQIDLPEDWSDQSSLLFVAPRDKHPARTAHPTQQTTEAVALNFVDAQGQDAQTILRQQSETLGAADPSFRVLAEEPFACRLGEGWLVTQTLTAADVTLRQLCLAVVIGRIVILATAACSDARFARNEAELRSILQSLETI